jgi:putative ABC transport system ATP-binding protein
LLVCDEPTSALDARTGHTIMELLRAVAMSSGRAVAVVTHDNRVYSFGDRIVSLEDGRVTRVERQTPSFDAAAFEQVVADGALSAELPVHQP